jgi:hypothetical protein
MCALYSFVIRSSQSVGYILVEKNKPLPKTNDCFIN